MNVGELLRWIRDSGFSEETPVVFKYGAEDDVELGGLVVDLDRGDALVLVLHDPAWNAQAQAALEALVVDFKKTKGGQR